MAKEEHLKMARMKDIYFEHTDQMDEYAEMLISRYKRGLLDEYNLNKLFNTLTLWRNECHKLR